MENKKLNLETDGVDVNIPWLLFEAAMKTAQFLTSIKSNP